MNLYRNFTLSFFVLAAASCNNSGSSSSVAPIVLPPSEVQLAQQEPGPGAENVPIDAIVRVRFSAPVQASSVTTAKLTLWRGGNQVAGTIFCDGTEATLTPSAPLVSEVNYRVIVFAGIVDANGQTLTQDLAWSFHTRDNDRPEVISISPLAGQEYVPIQPDILIGFSESLAPESLQASNFRLQGPSGVVPILVSGSFANVLVRPVANLEENQNYIMTVLETVTDVSGNNLESPYVWSFRTTEFTPPAVEFVDPAQGAINVSTLTSIRLRLSIDTNIATLTPSNFALNYLDPLEPVSYSFALQPATETEGPTVTLTPDDGSGTPQPLGLSKTVQIVASGQIRDLAGNFLGGGSDFVSTFQTLTDVPGNPTLLENAGSIAFSDVSETRVAVRADGVACAIWTQAISTGDPKEVWASIYSDPGGTGNFSWQTPQVVSNGGGNDARSLQIAVVPGTNEFVVAWAHGPSNFHFYFNRYSGGAWLTPTQISTTTSTWVTATPLTISIGVNPATSDLYFVWLQRFGTNRYQVKGRGFRYAVTFYEPGVVEDVHPMPGTGSDTAEFPFVTIDPDNNLVYAAWRYRPGNTSVRYNVYVGAKHWDTTAGISDSWTTPNLVESDNGPSLTDPIPTDLAFDPRTHKGFLLWRQKVDPASTTMTGDGFFSLYWDALAYQAGAWVTTSNLAPLDTFTDRDVVGSPKLAIDSHPDLSGLPRGTAMAVWEYAPVATVSEIFSRHYDPSTGWEATQRDIDGGAANIAQLPQVVNDDAGFFFASWKQKHSSGKFLVYGNRFDSATGAWASASRLENVLASGTSTEAEESDLPALGSNGSGKKAICWIKAQLNASAVLLKNAWGNCFP